LAANAIATASVTSFRSTSGGISGYNDMKKKAHGCHADESEAVKEVHGHGHEVRL
jgi:hypothetical protein